MRGILAICFIGLTALLFTSCSKDEEPVRQPADIIGIWQNSKTFFLDFQQDNTVRNFHVEFQDGLSIGDWTRDAYFYEPGYNLVIYLTSDHQANVYEVVSLTQEELVWCPVDTIDREGVESVGEIIGDIINKAQEGFKLDPELYQSFKRITLLNFLEILEGLDEIYPWNDWE